MRPAILNPLFASVDGLPGIGPRLAVLVERLAGGRIVDLLWHLPQGLIDRRYQPTVAAAEAGRIATLIVDVDGLERPDTPRQPWRVRLRDATGFLHAIYFNAQPDWLARQFPIGRQVLVSGRIERFRDTLQMPHPDIVQPAEAAGSAELGVEPVYALTGGLPPKTLRKGIAAALARLSPLPEWCDGALLARESWPGWDAALRAAHAPERGEDLEPTAPPRRRLAFDELLANQLALALVRETRKALPGRMLRGDGKLRAAIIAALPFALTASQRQALTEIETDLVTGSRMLRLLQGDVGSGKTLVALLVMAIAVEDGAQAALMAPTEILARQHCAVIEKFGAAAGLRVLLLTGRLKGRARDEALAAIEAGAVDIVVGTHALVQDGVRFRDLALAVVDEQHRFGVHQRLALAAKGPGADPDAGAGAADSAPVSSQALPVHTLGMSATPIPRSLLLTAFGDLAVSRLLEKPAGRKPVDTRTVPLDRIDEVVAAVGRAIGRGDKVFWVCPLVEDSETVDLAAATARHAELRAQFGAVVGLLHGRMKGAEKDVVMAAFAGRIDDADAEAGLFEVQPLKLLVATTVIEVGVDVPAATVIVIEHAERFGLAQLHQLRGRIGRGDRPATCILLYGAPLSETARARLAILRETDDGFRIAEEDLRLRGGGELLGVRQSGMPRFRLADLAAHADLLEVARADARRIVDTDPGLVTPRGNALRVLLYLFDRDAAVRTLRSG